MPLFRWVRTSLAGPVKGETKKRKKKFAKGSDCGSLLRLCLWSLAENMENVWTKHYTENYMDQYCFRYIIGPFNILPGVLLEELLSLLSSRRLVSRGALHLLLLPQLRHLSLSPCSGLVTPGLCQMITVRCPSLMSLDLSRVQHLTSPVLCDLLKSLTSLRLLTLAGTVCDGRVIETVASHCQVLQHLDVSRCHNLDPVGMLSLAHRPMGVKGGGARALKSLLALDIGFGGDETAVAAYLLLALPLLTRVALEGLGEGCCMIADGEFREVEEIATREGMLSFGELWSRRMRGEIGAGGREAGAEHQVSDRREKEEEGWASGEVRESSEEESEEAEGAGATEHERGLLLLNDRPTGMSKGQEERSGDLVSGVTLNLQEAQGVEVNSLGPLGRLCPDLCSLTLIGDGGAGQPDPMELGQWAGQLQSLGLRMGGTLSDILPAVQVVGASLASLSLEGVGMERGGAFLKLLQACPNLKALHVYTELPGSEEEGEEEEDEAWNLNSLPCIPHLKTLTLNFLLEQQQGKPVMSWRSLKGVLVCLLGGSPLLEKVSLSALPCPVDSMLRSVLLGHLVPTPTPESAPLRRLRHLELTCCDITGATAELMMASIDCLSTLDLSRCWVINKDQFMRLQSKATRRRQPLIVTWTDATMPIRRNFCRF
ncbi:hypothetical protein AGOR_G00050110 [Albula goreensis]|uniref:Uncharacterized protein n=1 Tax=Albula goreensis TaxID=1534307 RepID=A0A8T3E1L5_9TELE|nr:hypothetical protein AGOR_G00050110 [Albula goreensis]